MQEYRNEREYASEHYDELNDRHYVQYHHYDDDICEDERQYKRVHCDNLYDLHDIQYYNKDYDIYEDEKLYGAYDDWEDYHDSIYN